MKKFSEEATHPARALQAWQILISTAMNRQTHTYKTLFQSMYEKPAQGVLAHILGHIAYFCNKYDLPPLTVLVVNEKTGLPDEGILFDGDLQSIREKVYAFNWYDVYPPSENELKEIYVEQCKDH
ncbi:hypothetical protein [Moraxella bovoculi]|uniref:hypothetical protein n=1 Tax=Moraxella bovoculi TaxID=386891 RepID=UPI0012D3FE41|nr:hypothetical protein [Moraxella bovoculi]